MLDIVIASTNPGKIKEIRSYLDLPYINLLSLTDFDLSKIPEVLETGNSFKENALLKARAYYKAFDLPVIADDSGLIVPALNGEPGIYSARYAGNNATHKENNALLLSKINGLPTEQRKAFFEILIVYKDHAHENIFTGRCDGEIIPHPRGTNGFGYDPVFFLRPLNRTMAQLTMEEKNKISHRGKALSTLKNHLKKSF